VLISGFSITLPEIVLVALVLSAPLVTVTFTRKVPLLVLTFLKGLAVRVTSSPFAEASLNPGFTYPSTFLTVHLSFETSVETKFAALNLSEILSPTA